MAEQGNTSHDNAIGWMILMGVAIALFALFWYYFQYDMKNIFRWIRWGEMWVISLFTGDDYAVYLNGKPENFKEALETVALIPVQELHAETLNLISTIAMEPLRLPIAGIIALMGFWCMTSGPGTQYRRKFNLDGLIAAQSKIFPIIAPLVKFNPGNQPPRPPGAPVPAELPAFAEALGPEEWLAYNEIPVPDGDIDEEAAYAAFARQLGKRWGGAQRLDPYKQVLLAAFCLKASRKRVDADDMLGKLAQSWTIKNGLKLDKKLVRQARRVLANKQLAASTLSKCNQHGFETTALLRGLATAREEGGVLAPAQFVWLRAHDRTLWYPLNNLGRQSFHMEAIGAMAHYKAEKMTQRPIPKPKVQDAVKTIVEYMSSARARPIPQLDYSGSKKRGVKKAVAKK